MIVSLKSLINYWHESVYYSKIKAMDNMNIFIIDKEDVSKTLIENYLKDIENIGKITLFSDICQADSLKQNKDNYTIAIVDITENTKEILEFVTSVTKENSKCKFILISYNMATNSIVEALRSGAKDFLAKPLIKDELINSIKKVSTSFNKPKASIETSKIISTFSNKGGLGKTTVAVNLAKELADITKEKVVLVDLNMHLGDITAFLDLNPNYDIKYVIDNIEKADKDFLLGTLEQYKNSNFYILADSPYREPSEEISPEAISTLLEKLKNTFSYIVLDNTSSIDRRTTTVFDKSDFILFITTANLPTLRNCQRCLDLFDKLGYKDEKLKLILNRYINNEDYTIEDVETILNKHIYWTIPNNYFTVIESINKGLTLQELNPASNVTENYRQLAQEITNRV